MKLEDIQVGMKVRIRADIHVGGNDVCGEVVYIDPEMPYPVLVRVNCGTHDVYHGVYKPSELEPVNAVVWEESQMESDVVTSVNEEELLRAWCRYFHAHPYCDQSWLPDGWQVRWWEGEIPVGDRYFRYCDIEIISPELRVDYRTSQRGFILIENKKQGYSVRKWLRKLESAARAAGIPLPYDEGMSKN